MSSSNSYLPPHKRRTSNSNTNSSNWRPETTPVNSTFQRSLFDLVENQLSQQDRDALRPSTSSEKEEKRQVKTTYSCPNTNTNTFRRISSPDRKTPPLEETMEKKEEVKSELWSERLKSKMKKKEEEIKMEEPVNAVKEEKKKDNSFIFVPHSTSILSNRRKKATTLMTTTEIDYLDNFSSE